MAEVEIKQLDGDWIEILGVKYVKEHEYNAQCQAHYFKGRKEVQVQNKIVHVAEIQDCPYCS